MVGDRVRGFRVAFMGTPAFAVPALEALHESDRLGELSLVAVYTQPPRPSGRGLALKGGPVFERARSLGLAIHAPTNFKSAEAVETFAALELDLAIVAAYGLILPRAVLAAPRLGCLNLHASLLPRWRGAAPIQRAMLAGDEATGVDLMAMEAGLDTGPVLARAVSAIHAKDTSASLHDRLAALGADLLARHLPILTGPEASAFIAAGRAQDPALACYAAKISAEEARIDWTRDSLDVDRQIRAFSPYPGAYFFAPAESGGYRVKALFSGCEPGRGRPGEVLDDRLLVACGNGAVRLLRAQREGRQAQPAEIFARGQNIIPGIVFT